VNKTLQHCPGFCWYSPADGGSVQRIDAVAPDVDENMEMSDIPVIGRSCSAETGLPVSPVNVTIVFGGRLTVVEK
jgi:hypothetical protein